MHRSVNPDPLIRNILPWKPKQARPDAVIYALHYTALKGLSHEIDLKSFDKNLHNLT